MNYLQKKKLAFMSIVNSVKGFVRMVLGVFPLTLPNCVDEESITDYTIYGANGASGGVGEYDESSGKYKIPITVSGKNLLSLRRDGETFKVGGVTFVINKDVGITMNGTCTADTSIDVSADNGFTTSGGPYTLCGCFGGSTSTYYFQSQNGFRDVGNGVIVSEKADKNIIRLYVKKGTVLNNVTVYPMLIKGNYVGKVPDYEPYHEPITTNIYLDEPLSEGQSINYKKDREC